MLNAIRKRDIVITIGPSTWDLDELERCVTNGANIFRVNTAFADTKELEKVQGLRDQVSQKLSKNISLLVDIKGPEYRLNVFDDKEIKQNDFICFGYNEKSEIYIKNLHDEARDLKAGDKIGVDKNALIFEVISVDVENNVVNTKALKSGVLKPKKGVNFSVSLHRSKYLTKVDEDLIEYAQKNNWDYIALSFIENSTELDEVYTFLSKHGNYFPRIISKIESPAGIENIIEIGKKSFGIMIARGDLSTELTPKQLVDAEIYLSKYSNTNKLYSILATGLLVEMVHNEFPSISNIIDVHFAIELNTNALMLSEETSIGKNPSKCIEVINNLLY